MEQQMTNNNVLMKQIIDDYLNQNQIVNEGQEIHEDVVDTIQEPNDTKQIQEPIKKLPIIQIKPKSNVSIVDVPINGEDLNKLTLPKLREIAKEKGLCGYSKLKKADLIELIKSK
jgi:thiamine kinase-like enzyme